MGNCCGKKYVVSNQFNNYRNIDNIRMFPIIKIGKKYYIKMSNTQVPLNIINNNKYNIENDSNYSIKILSFESLLYKYECNSWSSLDVNIDNGTQKVIIKDDKYKGTIETPYVSTNNRYVNSATEYSTINQSYEWNDIYLKDMKLNVELIC